MSEVFGFDDFADDLDIFVEKSDGAVDGMHEMGDRMRDDARRNASNQGLEVTGQGVAGIQVEKNQDDTTVGWSRRPGLHLYFHEIGTYKDNPKPHMRPAFDENEQDYVELVQNKIT